MEWWKEKVIYQVYPRSFADGNGDGMGDLKGLTSKLDYLQELGIGGIWLSPHYPSPFLDCGYDISDYCAVGEEYGNLFDFKEFLIESKKRDIKVILDLVLNHTSDQHPWFLESKSSLDNPKRDWYVWQPNNGTFPNDWQSCFKGPAWTLDENTNEYYYHFFLKEQPDLNWRNPEVKKAMFESMGFWLDMGVDGFRIDAITHIYEDENLPNQGWTPEEFKYKISNTADSDFVPGEIWEQYMRYQIKQPELHDLLKELRELTDSYKDKKFLVGELSDIEYLGNGSDELHQVFNFPLMKNGISKKTVLNNQRDRVHQLPKGSNQGNTLSNHDVSRIRSKYANDDINSSILKHSAFIMLTLNGTPYIYYGEELGMKNYNITELEDFRDLRSVNLYHSEIERGLDHNEALTIAQIDTRDRCRTPMPWSNTPNGGFSPEGIKTWLPVDPEYKKGINVDDESKDPDSIFNFYKSLINYRNSSKVLQYGDFTEIECNDNELLMYKRSYKGNTLIVCVNYSKNNKDLKSYINKDTTVSWAPNNSYKNYILKDGEVIILQEK